MKDKEMVVDMEQTSLKKPYIPTNLLLESLITRQTYCQTYFQTTYLI